MTTPAGWTGRPVRRLEDPPLVRGQGRFTADLPARFRARFVRSAIPAGRITSITVPNVGMVFTAADLRDVKPIRPMLHKFGYVPIEQPVAGCLAGLRIADEDRDDLRLRGHDGQTGGGQRVTGCHDLALLCLAFH